MPAAKKSAADLTVGSTGVASARDGRSEPAGTSHLVDGWDSVCGAGRMRFVFPGRAADGGATCPDCVAAVVPAPRRRTTTAAVRSRAPQPA
jgi:hypothetical protein